MTGRGVVVALVGAESTGKTTLAHALAAALSGASADGEPPVVVVPEYLREFCDREGRTPRRSEQAHIAAEQTRRIVQAASGNTIVIADTTALQTAVYSDLVFGDDTLYAAAEAEHRGRCDLTLLMALDLPWQADGLQRDGPHVREPVDAMLRRSLQRAGAAYSVVFGAGAARAQAALACVERAALRPSDSPPRWAWRCERCDDPACERLARLRRN